MSQPNPIPCPHDHRPRPTMALCDTCWCSHINDLQDTGHAAMTAPMIRQRQDAAR